MCNSCHFCVNLFQDLTEQWGEPVGGVIGVWNKSYKSPDRSIIDAVYH
jgi:hypothetical protein